MPKDYYWLWERATNNTDGAEAVRVLTEILADKDGRSFISSLGRDQAESCIRILDHVSRDLCLPPSPAQMVSSGYRGVQPQNLREECVPRHVEETCRTPRTTTRSHKDNRKAGGSRWDSCFRRIWRCQVRNIHGPPGRGEDNEVPNAERSPKDKKGEH